MATARLVLLGAFWGAAAAAEAATNTTGTVAPAAAPSGRGNQSQGMAPAGPAAAATSAPPTASGLFGLGLPALLRAFCVLLGLAVLYYLGSRVLRTKKPVRKKYGLLSNREDNMELASLESDEDTLFETRNLRR